MRRQTFLRALQMMIDCLVCFPIEMEGGKRDLASISQPYNRDCVRGTFFVHHSSSTWESLPLHGPLVRVDIFCLFCCVFCHLEISLRSLAKPFNSLELTKEIKPPHPTSEPSLCMKRNDRPTFLSLFGVSAGPKRGLSNTHLGWKHCLSLP